MNAIFYISALVSIVSTIMVIINTNAIHALLYLILSLLSVAMIFFILGAPFVAALEVIIYAGAIMVLFIFVVMMLNLGPRAVEQERKWLSPWAWIGPTVLATILLCELVYALIGEGPQWNGVNEVGPRQVAAALLSPHQYVLGVELASILLLSGLVGAYHLGRTEPADSEGGKSYGHNTN
jgi:NADH-quinone oxidoreductase subunit J